MKRPFKEANIAGVVAAAARAKADDHRVFVAQLADTPKMSGSSDACPTIAEMIERIEATGWKLDTFTALGFTQSDRPVVIVIFRTRRVTYRSTDQPVQINTYGGPHQ